MEERDPSSSSFLSVAVAVNGSRSSRDALRWALDKFVPEGRILFYLLHVRASIIPGWEAKMQVQNYRQMCEKRQVHMEMVVLESREVARAVTGEVRKRGLDKLVVGASSTGIFSRKRGCGRISDEIANLAPQSCEVYAISKGRLSSFRCSSCSEIDADEGSVSSSDSSIFSTVESDSSRRLLLERDRALKVVNRRFSRGHDRSLSRGIEEFGHEEKISRRIGRPLEVERLKMELGHLQQMCVKAQDATCQVSMEVLDLSSRSTEEKQRLVEISTQEEEAREEMRELKQKREAAEMEARYLRESVEREAEQRRDAEKDAARAEEERRRLENLFSSSQWQYRTFTWEEILSATDSLSEKLKIGGGGNGTIYVGTLHHLKVAIKVIRSNEMHQTKQYKRELKVLGGIRHPHLLLLMGACPDRNCLVYEYMENGNLEDRLPTLNWRDRFRVSFEITSALAFLHNTKPQPIIHRDLKPSNILLDWNLVSKVGDLGLSTQLSGEQTMLAGTIGYLDPEYQRTGVVSPESDVFSLGIILLQMVTGKGPLGLTVRVEAAMEEERVRGILDPAAGDWPLEQAREMLVLGLGCAALRSVDRPDLMRHVLPALERMKDFAVDLKEGSLSSAPPEHFVCPILKEVMEDPCVAADGYTYERRAIEIWLSMNKSSPVTKQTLSSRTLVPNHVILAAIEEWRSNDPRRCSCGASS